MFETAVLSQGPQTKRVWTTCLGFTGQALLIGGMLLVGSPIRKGVSA